MLRVINTTTKPKIAKIIGDWEYCYKKDMPINVLRNITFSRCKTLNDYQTWLNQRKSNWVVTVTSIKNKKITNENIIIAGFSAYVLSRNHNILNSLNFPDLSETNNIFFVENDDDFTQSVICNIKQKYAHVNPVINIIDFGICRSNLPKFTVKASLDNIKIPLFVRRNQPNEQYFVDTQSIIDEINEYCEEPLMFKE